MKLYLGVDLHKRNCWVTVMTPEGEVRESWSLSTERESLLGYFGKAAKPAAVAVEATFNWYYFLDLIEPLGLELHLVCPYRTRAIASARIKHDRLDSRSWRSCYARASWRKPGSPRGRSGSAGNF